MAQNKRIIIPCRIAYLNCWKPSSAFGGDKYSLVAIISKSDAQTLETIQSAIDYVKEKSVEKWGGRIPPKQSLLYFRCYLSLYPHCETPPRFNSLEMYSRIL